METIKTIKDMQLASDRFRKEGKVIGFIPTMGWFHEGHLSLVRIARERADIVIVSIYVNPTQFGPDEDFDRYPRDFKRDEKLARKAGADLIFYPDDREIYPSGYMTWVTVDRITSVLCGDSRPGHFRGVTTICSKLFNIVKPHFAVFGQKDAQQVVVIKKMVKDLNFDLDIVIGPIVRESDGIAMSSRNRHLSSEERKDAQALYQSLKIAESMIQGGKNRGDKIKAEMQRFIKEKGHTRIDYIDVVDPETLEPLTIIKDKVLIALAVFVGKTRLIDNIII